MKRCKNDVGLQGRLDASMALLDARSRWFMELWLGGLSRREIAAELRICEDAASAIEEMAVRQVRRLLEGS